MDAGRSSQRDFRFELPGEGKTMKKATVWLLPLLLFYVALVIVRSSAAFQRDEGTYAALATNLTHGYFSAPDNLTLWFGPGYPIVLTPFVLLNLPWLAARLLNALLLFGAVLYFYGTVANWLPRTPALVASFALGLYPPFWNDVQILLTENLVLFVLAGFMYYFCRQFTQAKSQRASLWIASVFLAYLALTKVFFGYVILVALIGFLALWLWRRSAEAKRSAIVFLLALVWCIPYLLYTYFLTGKVFYWAASGGMSLYWMSTPYANEWGDWFSAADVQNHPELLQHQAFFEKLKGLSQVQQDAAFKQQAIDNIIHHPAKYVVNWTANIGRLLFSNPYSYTTQKLSTYFYLIPDMFLVVLFTLSAYPAVRRWNAIPYPVRALLFMTLIAFAGSSLLSAYNRQFLPIVPPLVLWLSYIFVRVLKIEIRPGTELVAT